MELDLDLDLRMRRSHKFLFKAVVRSICIGSFVYFVLTVFESTPTEMDKKLGLDQPIPRFIGYLSRIICSCCFDICYFTLMDKTFRDADDDELEMELAPAG